MNLFRNILKMVVLAGLLTACGKEDSPLEDVPDTLFRPINFVPEINGNNVLLKWTPIHGAKYLVYVLRTNTTDSTTVEVEGNNTLAIGDLYSNTAYRAGIRAISVSGKYNDSAYQVIDFTTSTENIFFQPGTEDIGINTITLRWDSKKEVTHVEVSKSDASKQEIPLDSKARAEGSILVDKLDPATQYTFRIYKGDMLRGNVSVKTNANLKKPDIK